jgi:hypothetical protein
MIALKGMAPPKPVLVVVVTVIVAAADLPPAVAVTVADPAALPVTSPLVLTVAIAVLDDAQVKDVPLIVTPLPSLAVPVS